ncbi:hypothetical protein H0H93_000296 [Arthromyces matolae]|nr:hypothetical protein H0H93_000296 [Arthromyces matolae]
MRRVRMERGKAQFLVEPPEKGEIGGEEVGRLCVGLGEERRTSFRNRAAIKTYNFTHSGNPSRFSEFIMRPVVAGCLFAYFLFSFVISTPIPVPTPTPSSSTAVLQMRTSDRRSLNDAVVTVRPMSKHDSHGTLRYKEALHSKNGDQRDIWVSPQLLTGRTDGEMPVTKETKSQAMKSDLATPSVLQVAGLMAQLLIKYPKETPAEIKDRMVDKGLKQSWKGTPDHFILEFPITDVGLLRQIFSPPLNNEGHASLSSSNRMSLSTLVHPTIPAPPNPLLATNQASPSTTNN